jgi:hypothetical protein
MEIRLLKRSNIADILSISKAPVILETNQMKPILRISQSLLGKTREHVNSPERSTHTRDI